MSAKKRLTDSDVRWLKRVGRKEWTRGRTSLRKLGKIVGCSAGHVRDILMGNRRIDVSEDEP